MSTNRNPPVGYTCNNIDNCIRSLRGAKDTINCLNSLVDEIDGQSCDECNVKDLCIQVKHQLNQLRYEIDILDELEELRSDNSELRGWGYELVKEIEELENR